MSPRSALVALLIALSFAAPAQAADKAAKQPPAAKPAAPAKSAQAETKPETETFDNWTLVCQTDAQKKKTCFVAQEMRGKDDKGAPGRLARVSILHKTDGKAGYVLSALVPLGINLQAGTAIAVDDKPQRAMKLLRCTESGCEAAMELDPAALQEMKKGTTLKVGFNAGAQTLVVPMPLKGFDKAMDKFGK